MSYMHILNRIVVMRYLFAIVSLGLACCSIVLSRTHPSTGSWFCRAGLCQIDAISGEVAPSASLLPESFVFRLNESPSDPYLWSDYADALAASGGSGKAGAAFEQAVKLGPNLPPILVRAAYFAFTHNEFERGAMLSNRVLTKTSAFDSLVFSYLHYFSQGRPGAPESAIPVSVRPAHAWASWIANNGSETEITDTSAWMQKNRLLDQTTALDLTWKLWQRQFFGSARTLWADWLQSTNHGGLRNASEARQLLTNGRFEREPDGSPFDWTIPTEASVSISRDHGLAIHFLGTANVKLDGIRQSVVLQPGRYHFSAVIESDGLTTDQHPFFRIFDPANSKRFSRQLPPLAEKTPKSEIGYDLMVPQGTEAVTIDLVRLPSERFDNKIEGRLHIYGASLVPLGDGPRHANLRVTPR